MICDILQEIAFTPYIFSGVILKSIIIKMTSDWFQKKSLKMMELLYQEFVPVFFWKHMWWNFEKILFIKCSFQAVKQSLGIYTLWYRWHWQKYRYRFSTSIHIFCHIFFIFSHFHFKWKLECILYFIFTLKISSITWQNLILFKNSTTQKSSCHILTTFWTK